MESLPYWNSVVHIYVWMPKSGRNRHWLQTGDERSMLANRIMACQWENLMYGEPSQQTSLQNEVIHYSLLTWLHPTSLSSSHILIFRSAEHASQQQNVHHFGQVQQQKSGTTLTYLQGSQARFVLLFTECFRTEWKKQKKIYGRWT
jgi:hypothetical protein